MIYLVVADNIRRRIFCLRASDEFDSVYEISKSTLQLISSV